MGSKFLDWLFPSRRRRRAALQKSEYELRPLSSERPPGRGFGLFRSGTNERIEWQALPPGFLSFHIDAAGGEAINSAAFLPGRHLRLFEENGVVRILDDHQRISAGTLPETRAGAVLEKLSSGERFDCISVWEDREAGRRTGLRVLVVDRGGRVLLPE